MSQSQSASSPPLGWVPVDSNSYIRPLVASEANIAIRNFQFDGHNDVCMGFSFTTTICITNIKSAFVKAIIRLRVFAPLLAADIAARAECGGSLCWVYRVPRADAEAFDWAANTLAVYEDPPTDEDFVLSMTEKRLPYEHLPGIKQYFGCHLLLRPDGRHSFFTHGTHAILDAQPNLYALRHIFDSVAELEGGLTLPATIPWGCEVANLPVDLVNIMVGRRPKDEGHFELEVPEHLQSDKPSLGIFPQRNTVNNLGRPVRIHRIIDSATLSSILARLKDLGFTLTVLFDAAEVLAILSMNAAVADDDNVKLDLSVVALQRFFPPEYPASKYISSCMTFLPLVVPVSTLPRTASQRRQLLHIMTELRSQYQYWLTHPNLPFAEITPHPPLVGRRSPYTPFLTNLGVIDRYIPEALPMGSEVPSVHVHELRFGHRIAHFHRPCTHLWSFRSQLYMHMQSSDIYDTDYLSGFLDRTISLAMKILEYE